MEVYRSSSRSGTCSRIVQQWGIREYQSEKEDEVQVISFDASENSTEETVESEMFSTAESSESFSSETILTEGTEIVPESTTELENTQENSELSTEVGEVLDNVEETDAEKIDTDFGLSAGAGEVLDSTEDTEIKETDVDLGLSVGAGEVFDKADEQARNVEAPQALQEPENYWGIQILELHMWRII